MKKENLDGGSSKMKREISDGGILQFNGKN